MGRLRLAFLAISLVVFVCVSEEIFSRGGLNLLRFSVYGEDVVISFSLFSFLFFKKTRFEAILVFPHILLLLVLMSFSDRQSKHGFIKIREGS